MSLKIARSCLLSFICELAASVGFSSPTLDTCRAQWERMVGEEGLGDLDHSGLFKLYDR